MFFALSKILLFFTFPLFWILLLLISAFIFRKRKTHKYLINIALGVFLIFSNTFLFNEVFKRWEGKNENFELQKYDAVVVLGGYSNWNTQHETANFNEASDRFIKAYELYVRGVAKQIVLTGGSGLLLKPEEKESIWAKNYLINFGVDMNDILVESESRNTHENALFCAELLKKEFGSSGRFLLVTSAFHMNRSQKCFEKTGLNFNYLRVDFCVDDDDYTLNNYIIPSAYTLEAWQLLIKEVLGYGVYWLRGYF